MSRHVVATVDEIAPGKSKLVTVKGREIGLFNVNGSFYALANRCPHAGGALCEGAIVGLVQSDGPGKYKLARPGEFLRCPWHGWEFDMRNGQSYFDPKRVKVRSYPVAVESGEEPVQHLPAAALDVARAAELVYADGGAQRGDAMFEAHAGEGVRVVLGVVVDLAQAALVVVPVQQRQLPESVVAGGQDTALAGGDGLLVGRVHGHVGERPDVLAGP